MYVYFGPTRRGMSSRPNVTITCQVCLRLGRGRRTGPRRIPPSASGSHAVSWSPLQDTYCNLGWTLLAADVNGDGAPDLVMGSPFAPSGGKQKGMVAAFHSGPNRSGKGNACWGGGGVGAEASRL